MALPIRSGGTFLLCTLRHIVIPSRYRALSVKSFCRVSFWVGRPFLPSVLSAVVVSAFYVSILYWYHRQEH